jgi:choline monooxygenase
VRFVRYRRCPGRGEIPVLEDTGAGADLHRVELEDEAVVQATQVGVRARLYDRGRYSPQHEQAVHHFHRWLAERMR